MSKKDVRLSQEDWDTLDDLLAKHGFGGYYDLVECLKGVILKFRKNADLFEVRDLPTVVRILMGLEHES